MSSDPLRVSCPCCSGSGKVSFLRSGAWINRWCPGLNGPADDDSRPNGHNLDHFRAKKKARIEYKRLGEMMTDGQWIEQGCTWLDSIGNGWEGLLVLVRSAGQEGLEDIVEYQRYYNQIVTNPQKKIWEQTTVDALGRMIAVWLWGEHKVARHAERTGI